MVKRINRILSILRKDSHLREVFLGTILAFSLKMAGSGLAFLFNVAVARLLGAEGAGLYFLAVAVTSIAAVVGRVGLDNSLLRFVASSAAHDDWAGVKGVYALGIRMTVVVSTVLTLVLLFITPWMAATVFKKPELSEPLQWMCLSILPFALINLQAESLKGVKRIRDAMLVQGIGVPLVSLLLVVPLAQLHGVIGVGMAFLAGTVVVAVLGMWAWHRAVSGHNSHAASFPFGKLWESCKPLFLVLIVHRAILPWAPTFLLGIWVSSEDVGIFGAANQIAMLVSFMLAAVNNVTAPKFAELYARKDMESLGRTARHSAMLVTILASPLFILLIFAGHWAMSIFGAGFESGWPVLVILSFGQFVNALTGSVGYLLMMSGHEVDLQNLTIWTTLLMLLVAIILIPYWGSIGAALAASFALIVGNVWSVLIVRKRLNIDPLPNWGRMLSNIVRHD